MDKAGLFGLIFLVVKHTCTTSLEEQARDLFADFSNPIGVSTCFGLTRSMDIKLVQSRISEHIQQEGLDHAQATPVFQRYMGWAIGNCIDTIEERPVSEQQQVFQQVQKNEIDPKHASKYIDQEEALRLTLETTRSHHSQHKVDNLFAKMMRMSERNKNDPNALKDKMEKLKEMNDKLGGDLQGRIKNLDESKGVHIFLGVFALGLTAILGFGCYYCFLGGGPKNNNREEELQKKLNEHEERLDRLKILEKELQLERMKYKNSPNFREEFPAKKKRARNPTIKEAGESEEDEGSEEEEEQEEPEQQEEPKQQKAPEQQEKPEEPEDKKER